MKESIVLNGLELKVLDEYFVFLLCHEELNEEYVILRRESSREYVILYNFEDDYDSAVSEFEDLKSIYGEELQ